MFRPKKMSGSNRGEYFLSLTEYYVAGGRVEPHGVWLGEGARELGLTGQVKKRDLRRLLDGFSPEGRPLVQNAGKDGRQSGWDCVIAAPKSVANAWAALPKYRPLIENAHDEAVRRTLADAQELVGWTRRGKGGTERERANLVWATFQHASTRNGDELLHTHCLALLPVVRRDGTTGALDPTELYRHQRALAQLYRAHLSYLLEREGFRLERQRSWFEMKGVPEALIRASSTRREEVLEATAAYGGESAKAREIARLETRREKQLVTRAEYFSRWQKRAAAHGLTEAQAHELVGPVARRDVSAELEETLRRALVRATAESAHFSEGEFLRFAAEEAQCRGFDPTLLPLAVKARLARPELVVKLGRDHKGDLCFTTPEMVRLEQDLLHAAGKMHQDRSTTPVPSDTVERAIARTEAKETAKLRQKVPNAGRVSFSPEQRNAVFHATSSRISVIEGLAGTGKTTLLAVVSEAYRRQGRRVIGTSTAGKAVRGLSEGAGIEAYTVARLVGAPELDYVGDFDRPEGDPGKKPRVKLDRDTVLIVDEAGMVGTRAMERLVREAERTGATFLLVGDSAQLQPVATFGGPFGSMARRFGSAKLTEITRQQNEWERNAVKQLQRAEAREALRAYAERGLVWVENTREEAITRLVQEWQASGGVDKPGSHQVFVSTNEERRLVNAQIQELLRREGKLGRSGVEVQDGEAFTGSRVMFLRKSGFLGVENGDMATVLAVNPFRNLVQVELDSGETVTVDLKRYGHHNLTPAFAITTTKGQGATVDHSYLLTGGNMTDLHSAYVQGSRARLGAKYFTDAYEAGDDLADLARQMSRRRAKDLAHDILEKSQVPGHEDSAKRTVSPPKEHGREREIG
jgi:conjugative relaxase-like TrwC/TraI family protein